MFGLKSVDFGQISDQISDKFDISKFRKSMLNDKNFEEKSTKTEILTSNLQYFWQEIDILHLNIFY